MIRLGRLTDYGIVLMSHLAATDDGPHNARDLAAQTQLPLPAVSKLLKLLARAGLLTSSRGAKGGYALARPASEITVPQMIEALEGPIALTDCTLTRAPAPRSRAATCARRGSRSTAPCTTRWRGSACATSRARRCRRASCRSRASASTRATSSTPRPIPSRRVRAARERRRRKR